MILPLKISIALCTYNGEKFLQEQLDSFLAQTRRPDELVICDDRSTDRTREILQKFKETAPFLVRLIINERWLGFRKNFEKALSLCQGDLISFSDQDDIWLPEKLKEVEGVFRQYPGVGYVFHDAMVVDESANSRGFSLWNYYGFPFQDTRYFPPGKFTPYCFSRVILGATITLSAGLRDHLLPLPENTAHDTWVSFAGSLVMPVIALPIKLNKYRQHTHQLFGASIYPKEKYNLARNVGNTCFTLQAKHWKDRLQHLLTDSRITIDYDLINQINDLISHLEVRGNINGPILKRVPVIFREIVRKKYHRYSRGWRSVIRDLWI